MNLASPTASRNPDVPRLRIGLVTWNFPVISETFVSTLALDLLAEGHDVRILTFDPQDRGPPQGPVHAEVARSDLLSRTGRAGLRERATGGGSFLSSLAPSPRARLTLREGPFDVVHCQFASLGLAAAKLRRWRLLRTRALAVHIRGYDVTSFVEEHGPQIYDRLFRDADLFIANCAHFKRRAIELGCPEAKLEVIGSPIDGALFSPPEGREPPAGRPLRLVAVGRLVAKKGFADAIAAVAILRGQGRDVRFNILGEGPEREALTAQIARLDLPGVVRLHGQATQDQIIAALHAADIALAPSVRASSGDEDAPVNTLKEAMASGLPVVATNHGGIPELVVPEENGLLVPERDPQSLAAAIAALAGMPHRWQQMGAAGRVRVLQDFERSAVRSRTVTAYHHAVSKTDPRPPGRGRHASP